MPMLARLIHRVTLRKRQRSKAIPHLEVVNLALLLAQGGLHNQVIIHAGNDLANAKEHHTKV